LNEAVVAADNAAVHFRLDYAESLQRRLVRRYIVRTLGPGYWIVVAVALVGATSLLLRGDRTWSLGIALSAAFAGLALPLLAYRLHLRNALATMARLPDPAHADFTANADGFSIENPVGRVSLPWKQLHRVLREQDAWLLLLAENQFVTVPLVNASPQDLARLEGYVRASGVSLK
jgi:hypothetical protein